MGSLDRIGQPDPNAARAAEHAQRELLEEIKEEMGEEYREIIAALLHGDVSNLSPEKQALIERVKGEIAH